LGFSFSFKVAIRKQRNNGNYINYRLCSRRKQKMKGYATSEGYMGLVQGRYMLFASEVDYREYMED
jgi:hypothetical protein